LIESRRGGRTPRDDSGTCPAPLQQANSQPTRSWGPRVRRWLCLFLLPFLPGRVCHTVHTGDGDGRAIGRVQFEFHASVRISAVGSASHGVPILSTHAFAGTAYPSKHQRAQRTRALRGTQVDITERQFGNFGKPRKASVDLVYCRRRFFLGFRPYSFGNTASSVIFSSEHTR
jgi:hypothetical protein